MAAIVPYLLCQLDRPSGPRHCCQQAAAAPCLFFLRASHLCTRIPWADTPSPLLIALGLPLSVLDPPSTPPHTKLLSNFDTVSCANCLRAFFFDGHWRAWPRRRHATRALVLPHPGRRIIFMRNCCCCTTSS